MNWLETVEISKSIWWDAQEKAMSCVVTAKQAAAKMMFVVASQFPLWEKIKSDTVFRNDKDRMVIFESKVSV